MHEAVDQARPTGSRNTRRPATTHGCAAGPRAPAGGRQSRQVESLPFLSTFALPPVYLRTVSRTLELSLQSSLQLSLTVLVCYRSRGKYLALGGVYHPLWAALSSNPTPGKGPNASGSETQTLPNRPCTLNGRWPRSGGLGHLSSGREWTLPNTTLHPAKMTGASVLGSSLFTRSY